MGRDSNGNYSLPEADFVTGTTIEAPVMNSNLGDLETAITESLSRNGEGGMLARLRGVDGTAAAPAYSFTAETDVGMYRAGSGDVRFADGAADLLKISASENRSLVAFKVTTGGATIDAGGVTVTAGGLAVTAGASTLGGGATVSNGLTVASGGATVTAGGATITAGGLTVTAGGATVTAGGLTVTDGGTTASGAVPASGTLAAKHLFISTGNMAATSGNNFPLFTSRGTITGATNVINLTQRAKNTDTVSAWQNVDLGLTYDVDASVAAGGSIYFGVNGATITSGTSATGADPANALTLANGNLKLSGTAPNKDEAMPNTLAPNNIPKAWAVITTDAVGGATLAYGFGVASVEINSTELRINFASSFTPAPAAGEPTYFVQASVLTQDNVASPLPSSFLANRVDIRAWKASDGSTVDLSATARTIFLVAFGAQ